VDGKNDLNVIVNGNFKVVLAEPFRNVLCQMQVNGFVVNTIVPRVIWVFWRRVAKIDDLVFIVWFSRETALLDTTTLILDENLVVAIVIKLDNAVLCIRDMVVTPHGWARLTARTTWGAAWIKDENVARLWGWSLYVS
jgi:hypothetical protein